MKKVKIIPKEEAELATFDWGYFSQIEAKNRTMGKISKKEIRKIAEKLGIEYDDERIKFAKCIMDYVRRR